MNTGGDHHPTERLLDLILGELAPAEADRALSHVAACPTCAREWAKLEQSTLALTAAQPGQEPPQAVRDRLMARVRRDAPRRSRVRALPVVAATLGGAAAATLLWLALAGGGNTSALGQRLAVLGGSHGMGGSVYMDTSLHRVTVRVWHLPRLPSGDVYEVWWTHGSTHVMGGCFGVDQRGDALITLAMPAGWQTARSIGITVEPAPGTSRPTGARLIGGALADGAAST